MRTRLYSRACGDFHLTQGAVEFHRTCQGFHAKLPFNGILNGRNLAPCFSYCSVPDFCPVWYHIDHYAPNNSPHFSEGRQSDLSQTFYTRLTVAHFLKTWKLLQKFCSVWKNTNKKGKSDLFTFEQIHKLTHDVETVFCLTERDTHTKFTCRESIWWE